MQLGQILGGKEAIKCFEKGFYLLLLLFYYYLFFFFIAVIYIYLGVSLLKQNLKETTDPEEKKWVKFELAAALCSWAEMYLTDEW